MSRKENLDSVFAELDELEHGLQQILGYVDAMSNQRPSQSIKTGRGSLMEQTRTCGSCGLTFDYEEPYFEHNKFAHGNSRGEVTYG